MSLNDESWELASIGLIQEGRKLQAYSSKQVRAILLSLKENSIDGCLKECSDYQPSGVLNPEHRKKTNKTFLEKLAVLCKGKPKEEQVRLMRMAFRNINNIANMPGKEVVKLLLAAEDVKEDVKNSILSRMPDFAPCSNPYPPRHDYNRERRFKKYSNWRH